MSARRKPDTAPPLVEFRPVDELVPSAQNARLHPPEQVEQIASSMAAFGFTAPVLVDDTGTIIAGHGRVLAAALHYGRNGAALALPSGGSCPPDTVPVIVARGWSDEQRRAYMLADNQLALTSEWDEAMLAAELQALKASDFDLALTGFDNDALEALLAPAVARQYPPSPGNGMLAEQFGAPPFSVLDTRQGYWTARRDKWLAITGNLTETKEGVLAGGSANMVADINEGSSNFDPVLAELMMAWFCPAGGKVLDPFGGEQTKGVVAGALGLHYHASEFRQEQVDVNRRACAAYPNVRYVCGDSEFISEAIAERGFNLCFTSPPYYDLEVYSKDDMSALGTYGAFMAKYETIFARCIDMMAPDAFLVVKVGEIRDRKTGIYRNFVGDNIAMFCRLGLHYYNEIVLLNSIGTAPQRAARYFNGRKLVKVHQKGVPHAL